jgi:CHAT domain-containing protein/Tfp pilus assembly protein PilF
MKKNNLIILIILSLVLFTCSFVYAQSHQLADEYWNKAHDLEKQGKYLEAAHMFGKSAQAEKTSPGPRMVDLAVRLNKAGDCYYLVGRFDKAIKYYEEALDIARKLGQEDNVSNGLNNIGNIYKSWHQYETAIKYYEEALGFDRKLGMEEKVAILLNNISEIYDFMGQYDRAIKYYKEALDIDRRLRLEDNVSIGLNNIGNIYKSRGQFDTAIKYYEEALDIDKKLGKEADDALNLKNLDMAYSFYWNKHDKVIKPLEQSSAFNKKLEMDANISRDLNNIGMVYVSQKKYETAIKYFEESISIKEKILKTATGEVRRDCLAGRLDTYQWLALAYIKDYDIYSAFQTIELGRIKLMAERVDGSEMNLRLQEVKQIQETLDEDTIIIVYANANLEDILQFIITREEFTGKEVSCKYFVQSSMDKYNIPIKTLLINQRGLNETKNDFDKIINYYSSLLMAPPLQKERGLRTFISKLREIHKTNTSEIGRGLYELLIKPVEKQIKNKKNLVIVPDGILAFVPFETLINEDGQYLIENHYITYIQSMGIRNMIRERNYNEGRKPLLAFGGAVYDEVSYDVDMIENETQLAFLKKNIYSDIENMKPVRNAYGALGIGSWNKMPETLNEVDNIKRVINNSNIITGRDVTEKDIKELSGNWTLYNYKVIHFATHCLAVSEVPELSAVVLSQFEKDLGNEDGYLRMGEIAKLDIQADLVTLSACETGLGKTYGGDGVTGLTQSFLLAGANSVSLSFWNVSDKSTSQFMVTMYDMVQNKDISYSKAITEVKRQFIKGGFGEKYKAPYYWAPFVYYGN